MSAMNNAARTFTEVRDWLSRVRNARGYYPIVRFAVPLALENGGTNVQCQGWKVWERQR